MSTKILKGICLILAVLSLRLKSSLSEDINNPQSGFNDFASFTQHRNAREPRKQLYFPTGAMLKLESMLEVPIVNPEVFGIGSKFKISFPLELHFDKILDGLSSFEHFEGYGRNLWSSDRDSVQERHKRSLFTSANISNNDSLVAANLLCQSGGPDRLAIFTKLEGLWDSYYSPLLGNTEMRGKDCLLRAICEVHEFPMEYVYGAFGEVAKLILSASTIKSSCDSGAKSAKLSEKLRDYAKAEMDGKSRRCVEYTKSCSISVFV